MAFILVALMIFFAMAVIFYVSLKSASLQTDADLLREQEALETARKIASTPEFTWSSSDCATCIDLDKVFALKEKEIYEDFWSRIPFIQVKRVHPKYQNIECTAGTYPACDTVTIVDKGSDIITHSTFVAVCRYDSQIDFTKCEIGKVIVGFTPI